MVELSTIAEQLQTALNNNEYGIRFDIKSDRNKYIRACGEKDSYIIPGVLTALSGNYEPLQGIKVYYMPINLELWGYSGLHSDVPFTLEQQKECMQNVVEGLNGTTQEIGGDTVIFAGATVTVGNIAQGSLDVRIPLLMQLQLTIVEKAELANDVKIEIDGMQVYATEFSANMEKQTESFTYVGQVPVKSLSSSKMRTFSGMMFLTDAQVYANLEQDLLINNAVNKTHSLVYKGNTYSVVTQNLTELLRMGAVVVLQVTFVEVG